MTPKISVIMPYFNGSATVGEALRSLQSQTIPDWEAVIADDGSREDELDALRPFLKDGRIRLLRRPHAGIPATRNAAIAAAHGAFIAFLDQDDAYLPVKCEALLNEFERDPSVDVAYGHLERMDAAGALTGLRRLPPPERLFDRFLSDGFAVPFLAVLIRRDAWNAVGPLDEGLFGTDDYDWMLRASRRLRFARIEGPVARQRFRKGTAGQSGPMAGDRLRIVDTLRRELGDDPRIRTFERMAHYALGSGFLAAGEKSRARGHLWTAWKASPFDPRAALKTLWACLP